MPNGANPGPTSHVIFVKKCLTVVACITCVVSPCPACCVLVWGLRRPPVCPGLRGPRGRRGGGLAPLTTVHVEICGAGGSGPRLSFCSACSGPRAPGGPGGWLGNHDWLGSDHNRVVVELKEAPFGTSSASSSCAAACSAFPCCCLLFLRPAPRPREPPRSRSKRATRSSCSSGQRGRRGHPQKPRVSVEPRREPSDRSQRAGAVQRPSRSNPPCLTQ